MKTIAALVAVLFAAPAFAQSGQSMTQPSANQNQSQTLTNNSQQPGNVSGPGARPQGQQLSQPSANQNQPQAQQNQDQNSRISSGPGYTTGTGPSR